MRTLQALRRLVVRKGRLSYEGFAMFANGLAYSTHGLVLYTQDAELASIPGIRVEQV